MAKKKTKAPPKSAARMGDMGSSTMPGAKAPFQFRGRTVEIMPPSEHDVAVARKAHHPAQGMLRIDRRDVMYEQTDEGIYSHEMMYQRFSTPEELAEELVRQWGTHIPAPVAMPMPMPTAEHHAMGRTPAPRSPRRPRSR